MRNTNELNRISRENDTVESIFNCFKEKDEDLEMRLKRPKDGAEVLRRDLCTYINNSDQINVIPGGKPGKCCRVLVVGIANHPEIEEFILRAALHVNVDCTGETTYIIFRAYVWDSNIWNELGKRYFKNVRCFKSEPGQVAMPLNT